MSTAHIQIRTLSCSSKEGGGSRGEGKRERGRDERDEGETGMWLVDNSIV